VNAVHRLAITGTELQLDMAVAQLEQTPCCPVITPMLQLRDGDGVAHGGGQRQFSTTGAAATGAAAAAGLARAQAMIRLEPWITVPSSSTSTGTQ
jgi:hypothetical protein